MPLVRRWIPAASSVTSFVLFGRTGPVLEPAGRPSREIGYDSLWAGERLKRVIFSSSPGRHHPCGLSALHPFWERVRHRLEREGRVVVTPASCDDLGSGV